MVSEGDELDGLAAPNCPRCLVPTQLATDEPSRWLCPECGLVSVES